MVNNNGFVTEESICSTILSIEPIVRAHIYQSSKQQKKEQNKEAEAKLPFKSDNQNSDFGIRELKKSQSVMIPNWLALLDY